MPNVFPLLTVVAVSLAGFVDTGFVSRCDHPQRLDLKSAYTGKVIIDGARQVHLKITIDDKGKGTGVLTFDPNMHDKLRSTEIALREIPVLVQLRDEQDEKGRRLYDLSNTQEPAKGDRWMLVRPLKGGSPSWLMIFDKNGQFRDAVLVE